jgi:6-pyruvoyltetrahydropterin/6-carboxytetrahydropterin synthase
MIILLHTETTIDSAHQLKDYEGKCSNIHGHTWFLDLWVKGTDSQLNKDGILFDFGNVREIKELLDHKLINNLPYFNKGIDFNFEGRMKKGVNPTAENLSIFIYNWLKKDNSELLFKIRLYETKIGKETYCEVGDF